MAKTTCPGHAESRGAQHLRAPHEASVWQSGVPWRSQAHGMCIFLGDVAFLSQGTPLIAQLVPTFCCFGDVRAEVWQGLPPRSRSQCPGGQSDPSPGATRRKSNNEIALPRLRSNRCPPAAPSALWAPSAQRRQIVLESSAPTAPTLALGPYRPYRLLTEARVF